MWQEFNTLASDRRVFADATIPCKSREKIREQNPQSLRDEAAHQFRACYFAHVNADREIELIRKRCEKEDAFDQAAGRMSSGNRCPLAMYSNAKRMKMNVETSNTQNASIAMT